MREFSPEIATQLREQLDRATAGRPAHAWGDATVTKGGTPRGAVIEAMFLMAAADGKVTTLEIAQFADGIETVFGPDAETDVEALVKRLAERLAAEGWDHRLAAVKQALAGTEMRETAFKLAAAVAFVDDTIEHAEAAALEALSGALGITSDRVEALLAEVRTELFGP